MKICNTLKTFVENFREPIRFAIVGVVATVLQYGIYYLLMNAIGPNLALTIGYVIAFICNFFMTTLFTFKIKPSTRNAGGFLISHSINWLLQLGMLNLFLYFGVSKQWAPLPMYMVCVPIQFFLLRSLVKKSINFRKRTK